MPWSACFIILLKQNFSSTADFTASFHLRVHRVPSSCAQHRNWSQGHSRGPRRGADIDAQTRTTSKQCGRSNRRQGGEAGVPGGGSTAQAWQCGYNRARFSWSKVHFAAMQRTDTGEVASVSLAQIPIAAQRHSALLTEAGLRPPP